MKYFSMEAEGLNNQITEHTDPLKFISTLNSHDTEEFLNRLYVGDGERIYSLSKTYLKKVRTKLYRTEIWRLRQAINDLRTKTPEFGIHSDNS
jgi:plasmid replication initiation protein